MSSKHKYARFACLPNLKKSQELHKLHLPIKFKCSSHRFDYYKWVTAKVQYKVPTRFFVAVNLGRSVYLDLTTPLLRCYVIK